MPRRRPPPAPDSARLRALLAPVRLDRAADGPAGWVPEEPPPVSAQLWLSEDDGDGSAPGFDVPVVPDHEGGAPGRHRPAPRVITVPVAFRGARLAVSFRAVLGLVVVLVAAGVFFGIRVAWAERAAAPEVVPAGGGLVASSGSAFASPPSTASALTAAGPTDAVSGSARGSPTSGATSTAGAGKRLVVDVAGQVATPGVVVLTDGARVVDVLAAAGGTLPGADVQRLNLARHVADGEQVFVPRPGETPPVLVGANGAGAAGESAAAGGAGGNSPNGSTTAAPVDLNSATVAALDTLPGVGPVLAQRIVDWRTQHGRFSSVDELGEVSGIGEKLLEQLRPKVRVS